ncbi:MAG: proline dehydrogenase family protein [Bacteroidota bacterium]
MLVERHGLKPNDPRIWFGQLLGMSDHISFNLSKAGYNVAKYVPLRTHRSRHALPHKASAGEYFRCGPKQPRTSAYPQRAETTTQMIIFAACILVNKNFKEGINCLS